MTQMANPGHTGATGPTGPSFSGGIVELSYNQVTTPTTTISATTEGTATTLVTGSSVTYGSGAVEIAFFCSSIVAGGDIFFTLHDDTAGVSLGILGTAGTVTAPIYITRRLVPGAGARIYSIRAYVSGGTTGLLSGAGGVGTTVPMYMRIIG